MSSVGPYNKQNNLYDRLSISTKASSNISNEQRWSRVSVLEMLSDRTRTSNLNHIPPGLNRLSSIRES